MDYFPLVPQTETRCLSDGVMVLYEKPDVAPMIDMLSFMHSYKETRQKDDDEIPGIFIDGKYAHPEKLLARLTEIFPSDEGALNTDIVIQIMDADRDFFEEYMNHLEEFILVGEEKEEEDTDHPLWSTYDMFMAIELQFFPALDEMH